MGHDGHKMGGRGDRDKNGGWFPARPADVPVSRKPKKLPKGVEGHALGNRGNKSNNDGCAVVALAMLGGIVAGLGGAAYGVVKGIEHLVS